MKKGFTLVELSIVLVIIGLLIGGILVGQSLIGAAKVRSMTSNLQQYEIAIQQFIVKFKQMPGDSNRVEPQGNANRSIDANYGDCAGAYGASEVHQEWYHLTSTGMLNIKLSAFSPQYCGGSHKYEWQESAGVYVPVFAVLKPYARDYLGQGFDTDKVGITFYQDYFGTYATFLDANSIDQKLDDGNISTGAMRTGDDIDGTSCVSVGANPSNANKLDQVVCELNYTKKFTM